MVNILPQISHLWGICSVTVVGNTISSSSAPVSVDAAISLSSGLHESPLTDLTLSRDFA